MTRSPFSGLGALLVFFLAPLLIRPVLAQTPKPRGPKEIINSIGGAGPSRPFSFPGRAIASGVGQGEYAHLTPPGGPRGSWLAAQGDEGVLEALDARGPGRVVEGLLLGDQPPDRVERPSRSPARETFSLSHP
jgi:hypothetical protein